MSKFKIRPHKLDEDLYAVQFSVAGIGIFRSWEYILFWDETFWRCRTFSKKRAEQVCRQLKSLRDVLNFQAETYSK